MKLLPLILINLIACFGFISAQEPQPLFGGEEITRSIGIRLHNSSSIGRSKSLRDPNIGEKELELFSPSAGLFWTTKKGSTMEFQVTRMWAKNITGESYAMDSLNGRGLVTSEWEDRNLEFGLRWEMIRLIPSISGEKLHFLIGFGAEAGVLRSRFIPMADATVFGRRSLQTGLSAAVSARVSYHVSPRWSLDLVLPFSLFNFGINTSVVDNPTVPVEERSLSIFQFDMLQQRHTLRLGISAML